MDWSHNFITLGGVILAIVTSLTVNVLVSINLSICMGRCSVQGESSISSHYNQTEPLEEMSGLFLSILAGVAGQMAAWQAWRPLEQHHRHSHPRHPHPQHHHHATLPGPPQQQGRTGAPRCQRLRRTWSTCPSTSWLKHFLPLQLLSS